MAHIYSTNYSSQTGTKSIAISVLNGTDLDLTSEDSSEVVEKLAEGPIDAPEVWRFGQQDVADVYKNTGVETAAKPSSVRGVKILVEHKSVRTVTDDSDANFLKKLPSKTTITHTCPLNELTRVDDVLQDIERALAGLFGDSDDVSSSRLASMIRGKLRK